MENEENYDIYEDTDIENDPIANALLQNEKNGFGLASIIIGILTLFSSVLCFPFVGGFIGIGQSVLGLVSFVLGIFGVRKNKNNRGMAIAGMVLGVIAVLLGVALFLLAAISSAYLITEYGMEDFLRNNVLYVFEYLWDLWDYIF